MISSTSLLLMVMLLVSTSLSSSSSMTMYYIDDDVDIGFPEKDIFFNTGSSMNCSVPNTCFMNNASLWHGGFSPTEIQVAIIDFSSNISLPTQYIYFEAPSTIDINGTVVIFNVSTLAGLVVKGDVLITVLPGANFTSLGNVNLVDASLVLNSSISTIEGSLVLTATSKLDIFGGSSLTLQSLSSESSITVGVPSPGSTGVQVPANTLEMIDAQDISFSANNIILYNRSFLMLSGIVNISTISAMEGSQVVLTDQVDMTIGQSSSVDFINATFTSDSSIQLDAEVVINTFYIDQPPAASTNLKVSGVDTKIHTALLNNTVLHITKSATLNISNAINVGALGGINIEGSLFAGVNSSITVGDVGIVVKSHDSKFYSGAFVTGDVYLENGTMVVDQTSVYGSIIHGVATLVIANTSNLLSVKHNYTQTSIDSIVYLKNIGMTQSNAYIYANNAEMLGQLMFSVADKISPSLTCNVIEAFNMMTGRFNQVQILNTGISNHDYAVRYTNYLITIIFNKENVSPQLALWKIFVILFCSIGGVFVIAFLFIIITRRIKRNEYGTVEEGSVDE
ncbi:hypothetical protein SAMD00019534_000990 [Acytostelium subglobosum LB1]|uniref:hypothetical protein n=1 Tax=Acytostelium subglobosum LB1 TaxID=1410327 RepID=UPI000644BC7E|nr:hypothetical protein SAMD00019534_000990 [Acytostelium subglobosum LB1]GAM16924.1 hypothetical protein SAMD00019534_000990 [Acytostelium subglobosum LB1]|eukprot:XP_012758986.1 hypothetical protein SAMD00019534_000990 [Acytostelium subglobosum LB1]